MIRLNEPYEVLAKDIITSGNLRVFTPETKIFNLTSKKLKILILLKLKVWFNLIKLIDKRY